MTTYIIVSIVSGILFGVLDGLINANPFAVQVFQVFKPITKESINFVAGIAIDLVYGFILAGLFLLLYNSLPGASGIIKGLGFALIAWFLRVVMYVASTWMMFNVPTETLAYILVTGLFEMLVLGLIYGFTLQPAA